jgi:hypothetical protein
MNYADFTAQYNKALKDMADTCKKKNADYTGDQDPFRNFALVEKLGIASTEQGFMTRMADKLSRLSTFISKGQLQVKDESVQDTLLDLANYCVLLSVYLTSKNEKTKTKI